MCWQKALPDNAIDDLVATYVRAYVEQVHHFVESDRDHEWALRLDTATGAVLTALQQAQLSTRIDLLDGLTVVEGLPSAVPPSAAPCASWGGASVAGSRRRTPGTWTRSRSPSG